MNHFQATLALVAILLVSCGEKSPPATGTDPAANDKPTIAVVNYPLAYFAQRLAGDFATILFDAPGDEDPAFWKPDDNQVTAMQQADLILLNGASYAKWTATTTLPFETTVDTSAAFASDFIEIKDAVTHSHGKNDIAHSHAGTAFTTWLNFKQASAQAAAAAEAIAEQWPDHKTAVMANLAALQTDLAEIDEAMLAATAPLKNAPVIASHPVYQYWARAYGLTVLALHWEPEMELTAEALADLEALRDAHPGATLFVWEGTPLPAHVETLQNLGLTSVVVSPCGNRPESGDFLTVMRDNIAALQKPSSQ